jgi:hypothetical protein
MFSVLPHFFIFFVRGVIAEKYEHETRGLRSPVGIRFQRQSQKTSENLEKLRNFQKTTKKFTKTALPLKQYAGQSHNRGGGCYAKTIIFEMCRGGFGASSLERTSFARMCSGAYAAGCLRGCGAFRA